MDKAYDYEPPYNDPPMPAEAEVIAMLEQSARERAVGLTVPLADVLAQLDAIADRAEAGLRDRTK